MRLTLGDTLYRASDSDLKRVRVVTNEATVAIKAAGMDSGGRLSSEDNRAAFGMIESKKYLILDP